MAIVNKEKDSGRVYLPSAGERLCWARQTLRNKSHRELAATSDIPVARLRRLEHPRTMLGGIQLAEMVSLAIDLKVFIPWLVDGIGHPVDEVFNEEIEWIRACEPAWRAPDSAPAIQSFQLAGTGRHFDLKTVQVMSEALAPFVSCGNGLMARPSGWVPPNSWVMFSVDGPGMVGQTNVRYLRYAEDSLSLLPGDGMRGWNDPETRLDLLPVNPLHFAYRIPCHYLAQCGTVLGQWQPVSPVPEDRSGLSFAERDGSQDYMGMK